MKPKDYSPEAAMPEPAAPFAREAERLRILESFEPDALVDDPELSALVQFAAHLCEVPVSQVTLVEEERQRFLVREGIEERETPREMSFCAHALGLPEMLEVRDTTSDARFAANPLVTGWPEVRFYAGQPLVSPEGAALGTICVVDLKPRPDGLTPLQREGMAVLARAVMRRLNARREQLVAGRELDRKAAQFAQLASAMPDIAWSANADGSVNYLNDRWYDFTGLDPEISGIETASLVHPEDRVEVMEIRKQSLIDGAPFEAQCRLRHRDGSWRWVITRAHPSRDANGMVTGWFGTSTDIDEFIRLSESRDLLAKELAHRIKNIFSVVIGLTMLKARAAPEHLSFAEDLTNALRSLGSAHEFVRVSGAPIEKNLHALLDALFCPYGDDLSCSRVRVSGADCAVRPSAATPLALVFHELATNSAKYGAISQAVGYVNVTVTDQGERYAIEWREFGGPPVTDNGKRGFGSRLVDMAVTGQLQGTWERRFEPDGLVVELDLPKSALAG